VVLILDHDEDGALGVMLNRPGDLPVEDALPSWGSYVSDPGVVFIGGPVTPNAVICLGRARPGAEPEGWAGLMGRLGSVDLSRDVLDLAPAMDGLRMFAGYAGWSPGQLEGELRLGGWIVLEAEPDDVFSPTPERLWGSVLKRQGGELAWLHTYPLDPALN
jgi:putative transcriptional regulator